MKDWFLGLEDREQRFVAIGAVVVLLAVLYAGIWSPLEQRHQSAKADVEIWSQALADLKALRPRLGTAGATTSAGTNQSPIVIVDQTLQSRGLTGYRTRSQPVSSNGIRVDFENVAFDDLILWLGDVSSRYDMHVQQGAFTGGNRNGPGRINASLTLERAP